jgi:hypothetical protein
MAKSYGPGDLRRLSTRATAGRGSSDVHSRSAESQSGTGRLSSKGMLARLHDSVFGNGGRE